jgi:hypothetical protein
MKRVITIGASAAFALAIMSTYQVVKAPTGFAVVKAGQAAAADLPPPPPPPPHPVGKGKAPIGKGKAPIAVKG